MLVQVDFRLDQLATVISEVTDEDMFVLDADSLSGQVEAHGERLDE